MKTDRYTKGVLTVIAVLLLFNFLNVKLNIRAGKVSEAGLFEIGNSENLREPSDGTTKVIITGVEQGKSIPVTLYNSSYMQDPISGTPHYSIDKVPYPFHVIIDTKQ